MRNNLDSSEYKLEQNEALRREREKQRPFSRVLNYCDTLCGAVGARSFAGLENLRTFQKQLESDGRSAGLSCLSCRLLSASQSSGIVSRGDVTGGIPETPPPRLSILQRRAFVFPPDERPASAFSAISFPSLLRFSPSLSIFFFRAAIPPQLRGKCK